MTATGKSRIVRLTSSTLRLDPGEVAHVGVDVHEASSHVALVTDLQGLVATWTRPADPDRLVERLKPIAARVARVVSEAGTTGFALVRRPRAAESKAEVIAPSKGPTMPGPEARSDRLDGRKRAVFARKGRLRPVRVPDEPEEADRQVVRLREPPARKLRVLRQQIEAFLLPRGIAEPAGRAGWAAASVDGLRRRELGVELRFRLEVRLAERRHAREQVARATRRPEERAGTDRRHATASTPRTVPGVGPITAMTSRVERHDPGRFRDGGQVARMIGLAPRVLRGGPTRREGRLRKSGDARLRTVLVEAAWGWVAGDEAAKGRCRRLVASRGDGKEALVGLARRLAILRWRLSLSGMAHPAARERCTAPRPDHPAPARATGRAERNDPEPARTCE